MNLRIVVCFELAALLAGARAFAQRPHCPPVDTEAASSRPNIVFILTDDQDLLLQSMDYMPNVKALLADQGATFTNFFVPLSLCCPSRTGILRGQYPHNHKVWTNEPPDGGFPKAYADNLEPGMVCTDVDRSGYHTFFFGKYLNGYPATASQTYIPPGWDDWYSPVGGDPYSEYNYQLNADGTIVSHGNAPADYLTDVMKTEALSFLKGIEGNPAHPPFFMHLTTFAPHRPSTPAPRHVGLFPTAQAPRTPSFNESDVSEKPAYIQALPLLTGQDVQSLDDEYRLRLQSLQAVDEMVAALVAELQADGLLQNTYLIFASDNGYHMGQHRFLAGKYTPYETDIRVPLVVRGPGVPAGLLIDQFASNVDLAPTIAELTGTTLSHPPDGRSLVSLLQGHAPATWRQTVLIEQIAGAVSPQLAPPAADRQSEPHDPQDLAETTPQYPGHAGFRTSAYKYVEYDTGERELYFLNVDPDELNNRASAASLVFMAAASAYLSSLKACAGPGCGTAEESAPPSPLGLDFVYTPASPTDATPVTLTATSSGVPPLEFTWNLCGQQATGQTVTHTFPAGTCTVSLHVRDSAGWEDTVGKTLTVAYSVTVSSVRASQNPFKLTVQGGGFKVGCTVLVGGNPAPTTKFVSVQQAVAKGSGLNGMVPKGTAVPVIVRNTDGSMSAPFSFTR